MDDQKKNRILAERIRIWENAFAMKAHKSVKKATKYANGVLKAFDKTFK